MSSTATTPILFAFDGTTCEIYPAVVHGGTRQGFDVVIVDGEDLLLLETVDGGDLYRNALANVCCIATMGAWARDRIAFVASLASRRLARGHVS